MINHCKISQEGVILNESPLKLPFNLASSKNWKKELYLFLGLNYPKFHKMDELSKMTILSIEMLKKKVNFENYEDDEISLIFSNSQSSSYTDLKFIESYTTATPSPSLFVYTLPNITTGELAIYMKWYGENMFLIQEKFELMPIDMLLKMENRKGAKACVLARIEKTEQKEACTLFFIDDLQAQNQQNILNIYNQKNYE